MVCTPHIGAATQEAQPRIARRVAKTVEAFNRYGGLRDCVYNPRAELRVDPGVGGALLVGGTLALVLGGDDDDDDDERAMRCAPVIGGLVEGSPSGGLGCAGRF